MEDCSVLVVGAGVAGLTCAALLHRQGVRADIIEREPADRFTGTGYMLGLLPLGGRVLNSLDLRSGYEDRSIEMEHYRIRRPDGAVLQDYPLESINASYGSYRGVAREDLLSMLLEALPDDAVRHGLTVLGVGQDGDGVAEVSFSDGSMGTYDIVVVADGLHSQTRAIVVGEDAWDEVDTGWGGWVAWLEGDPEPAYDEWWGDGTFLGTYPVRGRTGVFLGGPVDDIEESGPGTLAERIEARVEHDRDRVGAALEAIRAEPDPFFWRFVDGRCRDWRHGRVVLLGDAATGFVPTAGVGASMAMDSAAALVDELSRMDRDHITFALDLFERRQRDRVERAQGDSRRLGRIMFVRSGAVASLRDHLLPHVSVERMLSGLGSVMGAS